MRQFGIKTSRGFLLFPFLHIRVEIARLIVEFLGVMSIKESHSQTFLNVKNTKKRDLQDIVILILAVLLARGVHFIVTDVLVTFQN